MTICRYYLQGTCRFGDRCRFEHVDPDYSEDTFDNSYQKFDHGYQNRYRQQGGNQRWSNNYQDHDVSYGPRRYDSYESQNQRYASNKHRGEDSFQNASYGRNNYNYYSNERYGSPERQSARTNDGFHKQHQPNIDYYSKKNDRNQYGWVSEDYKRTQQTTNTYNEKYVNKSSKSSILFSFKDDDNKTDNDIDEKTLILAETIKEDVTAWELANIWPFSCYFPFAGKICFPGFNDISFEELRCMAVKAKESNSFPLHIKAVEKTILDINTIRNHLKKPSRDLLSLIGKLKDAESLNQKSEIERAFVTQSLFNTQNSIVNQNDIFGSDNSALSFSFKQPESEPLKSAAPVKSSASSFSFKLQDSNQLPSNVSEDCEMYTPFEELSEQDKEQFSAPTFTLGKIPTVPPPKVLCF